MLKPELIYFFVNYPCKRALAVLLEPFILAERGGFDCCYASITSTPGPGPVSFRTTKNVITSHFINALRPRGFNSPEGHNPFACFELCWILFR